MSGTAPNRSFILEWRNVVVLPGTDRVTVEVIFTESGSIGFHYGALSSDAQRGGGATVGIETESGTAAAAYSFNEVALTGSSSLTFSPAPAGVVSGTVTAAVTGAPVAGATVTLTPGGASATTGADGGYQISNVPVGEYTVDASVSDGRCAGQYARQTVNRIPAVSDVDLSILGGGDEFGYTCTQGAQTFVPATDAYSEEDDDRVWRSDPPFPVRLYGQTYTQAWIDTNGAVTFQEPTGSAWDDSPIPSPAAPNRHNAAVYPLWDDWVVDSSSTVRHDTVGTAPNRKWIVEWRNVLHVNDPTARLSFEVIFEEAGAIVFTYADINPANPVERGGGATVGIEDGSGTIAFQYLREQTLLASGQGVRFVPGDPGSGSVTGTITCLGSAVAGATVTVGGGSAVTATNGSYTVSAVPAGTYPVIATPAGGVCGGSHIEPVTVGNATTPVVDFSLTTTPAASGYTLVEQATSFVPANTTVVALTGDDVYTQITLPFPVNLYGRSHTMAWVDANGLVAFADPGSSRPDSIALPSPTGPAAALCPLWDDWVVDSEASVRTAIIGTAPARRFVIEWRNVHAYGDDNTRVSFEVILDEAGGYTFAYTDLNGTYRELGGVATIGLQNETGTAALQYSHHTPVLRPGVAVRINPPTS